MANGVITATITAKTGPGITVTAQVLQEVDAINFDFVGGVITVFQSPDKYSTYQYSDIATVSISPSAKTVTIST